MTILGFSVRAQLILPWGCAMTPVRGVVLGAAQPGGMVEDVSA